MLDAKDRVIMVSELIRYWSCNGRTFDKKRPLVSLAARNLDEIPIQNEIGKGLNVNGTLKKKTTSRISK